MPLTNLAARLRTLYQRLQSLRVVIAATVVLGVVLATTVSYLDQVSGLRQRHIEQTQAALDRLGHLTALALREPLWQFEVGQANSILEAALTEPDVVSMSVVDNMQHAFAAQQRPTQDQHLVLEGSYAIQRGGQKVGTLHIRMSTAGYLRTQDSDLAAFDSHTFGLKLVVPHVDVFGLDTELNLGGDFTLRSDDLNAFSLGLGLMVRY